MNNKISGAVLAAALLLSACGGGGSGDGTAPAMQRSIGPQLRPCETTGPNAPPCPASQAAGGK